jgi:hypothetical protein
MLANILEQAMYCGLSLSRVGADFRTLLPALFEARVLDIFKQSTAEAKRQFEWSLEVESSFLTASQSIKKASYCGRTASYRTLMASQPALDSISGTPLAPGVARVG